MVLAIEYTDGYKVGHYKQMPEGVTYQLNNFTPRSTRRENNDKIVFFGLQYFIKRYLIEEFNNTFFLLPKEKVLAAYHRRIKNYLPPGSEISVQHIADLHDLGFLPIMIKAVEEGSRVKYKVPPVTIESTMGEGYVWLVGYLETLFSNVIWGPCTSATTAYEYRKLLTEFAMETVGNDDFVKFQAHDFSFRGLFGPEAAQMSGAAHLLSFVGTDTIPAIGFLEDYYGADCEKELVGCSVDATEHSVMCTGTGLYIYEKAKGDWSRIGDAEFSVFKRLVTEVYPNGIISIVSDTFSLWVVLNDFLVRLKKEILARDGKVVIRPDSGNPVKILCGYKVHELEDDADITYYGTALYKHQADAYKYLGKYYHAKACPTYDEDGIEIDLEREIVEYAEVIGVVESLWNTFGGTTTEKGYKLLDSHIGCIYGDSITTARARQICQELKDKGFASINWIAGVGSFTYQYTTRDTDGWAMKATFVQALVKLERDDVEQGEQPYSVLDIPIFKDPITDNGGKKSARGRLQVIRHVTMNQLTNRIETEDFELKDQVTKEEQDRTALGTVYKDGKLIREQTLAGIRHKIDRSIKHEAA